jgi:hypothetical protein
MIIFSQHLRLKPAAILIAVVVTCTAVWSRFAQEQVAPHELVQRTVDNELKAAKNSDNFMFRSRKQTSSGSQTKLMVQTRDATAGMLVAINDQPLTSEQRRAEEGRLQNLIHNPEELKRKQKQERDDEERIARIMRALPDAFLYEYADEEKGNEGEGKQADGLVRLNFRSNPKYNPPTRVEQVLAGMKGSLLIDPKALRIAQIDGTLFKDVGFGWGILGHLDKGGRFQVEQAKVENGDWAITRMRLNFTGKVFLFKRIAIKNEESFSDFRRVPRNLSFAEGVALLKRHKASENENKSGE